MDLSAQALWQEKHTFSLTKSQYLVLSAAARGRTCSSGARTVRARCPDGARMRVPTCSARPAPRYAA
eukprot:1783841-Prymnesium_polylepis.1